MEYILFWIYTIIGFFVGVEFVSRKTYESSNIDISMVCIAGALLIYFWPIYLLYYFYNTEEY